MGQRAGHHRQEPVQAGQRFGRLTVIDPERFALPARSQLALGLTTGERAPLCRCDCGTVRQVRQSLLRGQPRASCGCRLREEADARTAIRNLKGQRVKRRRQGPVQAGQRFGRLVVIDPERFAPPSPSQLAQGVTTGNRSPLCRCDCGTELQVKQNSLRRTGGGATVSCGCWRREEASIRAVNRNLIHGLTGHPLFGTWWQMLQRCENSRHRQYKDYGGRGISVCDRWHDVRLFVADIESLIGPRPLGMTLDRADNDGNYEPGNIRWATRVQRRANRRNAT